MPVVSSESSLKLRTMSTRARNTFSTSSLSDLCLCKLVEELDYYSPEALSLLPPVQRKELLLLCPVVSICHLERTCAFDDIDSDTFWDDLRKSQSSRLGGFRDYDFHARLTVSEYSSNHEKFSSSREKYFTFLTTMIFSGDRFSGVYGWFVDDRDFYEGCSPPPEQRSCPDDVVNDLVTYRKPKAITIRESKGCVLRYAEDDNDFYYPLPSRDVFGKQHDELYEYATKGQYVHSRYSHYISKENHYRLSDDDAVSLIMNECHYYPKKLFLHEYEHMHWRWSHGDLTRLLTQFFCKLESLSLQFRQAKDIDGYVDRGDCSKEALELVLSCCFSSPVLSSLDILDPVLDDTSSKVLSSTLATMPCPSLKKLDMFFWVCYSGEVRCLEALAKIIASHGQLTEISVRVDEGAKVNPSAFSYLYASLIGFVQRQEFSKLTLKGQVPMSLQLKLLLDAFLKTPCGQPQDFHLKYLKPARNEPASTTHNMNVPVGDRRVPIGALEYKSLLLYEYCNITVDFCNWLFSHEPLVLKAFNFDASIGNLGEYGRFEPSETALPVHLLSENALFQTQELSLPIFDNFPNQALQHLFQRQQLTRLTLRPTEPPVKDIFNRREEVPKPCNIDAITEILSYQKEQLVELTIYRQYFEYVSIEPSTDMERFGDALFSLNNFKVFSFQISVVWKQDDTSYLDTLYNSWLKHGRKKLKSFQMGKFEYRFSMTDELARKLDEMGLVITTPSRVLELPTLVGSGQLRPFTSQQFFTTSQA